MAKVQIVRKKRRSKLNPKRLLAFGSFLLLPGLSLYVWHSFADAPTQEKIERFTLTVIDVVRENHSAPAELVFWLDLAADRLPLLQGKTVNPGVSIANDALILGGTPTARRDLTFLENPGYLVGYDERRKSPAWVAYKVFPKKFALGERPEKFETDPRTSARVEPSDYTNSGYDRGHMAPNRAIALCYGPEAQQKTFLMSNIVPQIHGLNGGFWSAMERRIMDRYTRRFDDVWVICGPIFELGVSSKQAGKGLLVPDEFFLIIADRTPEGIRTSAFIIPHREIDRTEEPTQFLTSIRTIETRTGLNFFSQFSPAVQEEIETVTAKRAW